MTATTAVRTRRVWLAVVVWAVASTVAAAALLALQPALGLDPSILTLVMLAPAVGAGVCWLTARRHLPDFGTRTSTGRFASSVGLALLAVAVFFAAVSILRGEPPRVPSTVAGVPVVVMIAAQLAGSLGEEIGFRGVLFHALGVRLPRPVTAVVVGILFGVWHVQYFALPLVEHAAFVLGTIALTVTMAYVMTGSFWQRMASCTIIHTGANLALAFTTGATLPMTTFSLAIVLGCLVVTPITLLTRKR